MADIELRAQIISAATVVQMQEGLWHCPLCLEAFETPQEKIRHVENAHGYDDLDLD